MLNDLDLRLDVLERELGVPPAFKFTQGTIKELRIHIPWSAMTTKPVVVTLIGLDCILTFDPHRKHATDETASKNGDSTDATATPATIAQTIPTPAAAAAVQQDNETGISKHQRCVFARTLHDHIHSENLCAFAHLPTMSLLCILCCVLCVAGSSSWALDLLTKMLANLTIVIKDLNFHYIEQDMLASLMLHSATLMSTDAAFKPALADLQGPWKLIQKVFEMKQLSLYLGKLPEQGMKLEPQSNASSSTLMVQAHLPTCIPHCKRSHLEFVLCFCACSYSRHCSRHVTEHPHPQLHRCAGSSVLDHTTSL